MPSSQILFSVFCFRVFSPSFPDRVTRKQSPPSTFLNDMKKILLLLAIIFGVALLGQPQAQAGVFIGLPIPLPVPVFYGPAYYPGGYYYGPRGYAYYPRPYWRHRAWAHGHWRYN
jgi:hypothetical protein